MNHFRDKWLKVTTFNDQAIEDMAKKAERFCARWYRNEPLPALLVLAGVSGTGKTLTARAIHRWANAHAQDAYYKPLGKGWGKNEIPYSMFVRWPEITDQIYQGNLSAMDDMLHSSLLVLDDAGAENDPFRKAADKLCQILSRREFRFTVLTTNVKQEEWTSKFDMRIADRLMRNSEIVSLFKTVPYTLR